MEDLKDEIQRTIRRINIGANPSLMLDEMSTDYHPPKSIGKKKYKGEVVLAHSRYHQQTGHPCQIYEHYKYLDAESIIEARRKTEGYLLCGQTPEPTIDTHAFIQAWCKGHCHRAYIIAGDYKDQTKRNRKEFEGASWDDGSDDECPIHF